MHLDGRIVKPYNLDMENVVPFPATKPKEAIVRMTLEDLFSVMTKRKTVDEIRIEKLHKEHLDVLRAFSVPDLRRFWDEIGDNSFYEGPEGMFDCANIHQVLNEKGDGYYCAV